MSGMFGMLGTYTSKVGTEGRGLFVWVFGQMWVIKHEHILVVYFDRARERTTFERFETCIIFAKKCGTCGYQTVGMNWDV